MPGDLIDLAGNGRRGDFEGSAPPLGVYVHWPYCARICPYCDFNVYRTREVDAARWRDAFARDLRHWAAQTPGRRLRSLYFGGGTPSLAPLSVIEGVIADCAALFGFEDAAEIGLEANPTDAELQRFRDFAGAGVNRLSLGVQSFDDAALRFLKRNHDAKGARAALDLALSVFPRASFDLIYALPDEAPAAWRAALREALKIGTSHVSLYQLTIEDGTPFDRAARRGLIDPPTDERAADLFDIAQDETTRAGLLAYEVSNHARPGAESRHNLLYWTGGDYIGVGPGAHGRITAGTERLASEAEASPEAYLAAVFEKGCGAARLEALDPEARLVEKFAMGLRLADGVTLTPSDRAQLGARIKQAHRLAADDHIFFDGAALKATGKGRRVLNAVLADILSSS